MKILKNVKYNTCNRNSNPVLFGSALINNDRKIIN